LIDITTTQILIRPASAVALQLVLDLGTSFIGDPCLKEVRLSRRIVINAFFNKKLYKLLIFSITFIAIIGMVILFSIISKPTVPKGTIRGRVLDENKKLVRNARVCVYLPGGRTVENRTNWFGRFEHSELPDDQTYRIRVSYHEYGHQYFDGLSTGENFDLQIFPHGYELFGKQAPPLQVEKWFNSQPQSLQQLQGKVVLLQIGIHIDTYNDYNRTVLQMHEKYADQGLIVIALYINTQGSWRRRTNEEEIITYLKQNNIDFPVGLDKAELGSSGTTYKAYGSKASPAKYLIDKKGILRCSPMNKDIEKWILRLLAE